MWHQGRVVMLGDAAHATLPYMGQGYVWTVSLPHPHSPWVKKSVHTHGPSNTQLSPLNSLILCVPACSATQAIEDGVVLVNELAASGFRDVEGGLTRYHEGRSARTKKIVDMAWYVPLAYLSMWEGAS